MFWREQVLLLALLMHLRGFHEATSRTIFLLTCIYPTINILYSGLMDVVYIYHFSGINNASCIKCILIIAPCNCLSRKRQNQIGTICKMFICLLTKKPCCQNGKMCSVVPFLAANFYSILPSFLHSDSYCYTQLERIEVDQIRTTLTYQKVRAVHAAQYTMQHLK